MPIVLYLPALRRTMKANGGVFRTDAAAAAEERDALVGRRPRRRPWRRLVERVKAALACGCCGADEEQVELPAAAAARAPPAPAV